MVRKLVVLVLLAGCAVQPIEPTQTQLAVIAYYADRCKQQGVNMDDEMVVKGCILSLYERDIAAGRYASSSSFGNALQGMGNVLQSQRSQQRCATTPDYLGGWVTTCN